MIRHPFLPIALPAAALLVCALLTLVALRQAVSIEDESLRHLPLAHELSAVLAEPAPFQSGAAQAAAAALRDAAATRCAPPGGSRAAFLFGLPSTGYLEELCRREMALLEQFDDVQAPAGTAADTAITRASAHALAVDAVARAHDDALDGAARLALAATQWMLVLTVLLGGVTALVAARRVARIMHEVDRTNADLRASEARIRHLAHVDEVTSLPNRNRFREYLGEVIESAGGETRFVLMFIDLDGFKAVNDSLSHAAGDELLALVSVRLGALVRERDMVARLGGDEFVVLIPGVGDEEQSAAVARRILTSVSEPYEVAGVECHVTASIGITVFPDHGGDSQTLLRKADLAMYEAKRLGKNGYVHFSARAEGRVRERVSIESALRRALPRGELTLLYQPVVDLTTMRAGSVEALLRWRHPVLGEVPPDRFVPVAEESGLILEIGAWVIDEACRQVSAWRAAGAGHEQVAVNVTHHQLLSQDFRQHVQRALADHALPGDALVLEITESALMERVEDTLASVRALVDLGVEFALDDFGTGYSSLSRLHTLPISSVKIDRSFLSTDRDEHRAIILTILGLARVLGLRVVGEGVEDESSGLFLADAGCSHAQGYFFAAPVEAGEIDWAADYRFLFHPESDLRRLMGA